MQHSNLHAATLLFSLAAATLVCGCQSSSQSASSNQLAEHVGIFSPPPSGIERPRVGVPKFEPGTAESAGLEIIAADQLATLLVRTGRFDVIERSQLQMLLDEQDLEGIVQSDELAEVASVRGVDYLLLGRVTHLRSKATRKDMSSGIGALVNFGTRRVRGGLGAVDVDRESVEIEVECGVDLRLVDPSTGATVDAMFSEYSRTDTAAALGVNLLGGRANAEADLEVSEDDRGLLLRLAFDDALRRMLPSLDRHLVSAHGAARPAAAPGDAATVAAYCASCGTPRAEGAAFCAGCGASLQP